MFVPEKEWNSCYIHCLCCKRSGGTLAVCRAAERMGGTQGKYKCGAHNVDCGRGLGARSQKILSFYVL